MVDSKKQSDQSKLKLPISISTDLEVVIVRVLVTVATVTGLYLGNTENFIWLAGYMVVSEVINLILVYFSRVKPQVSNAAGFFYVINSISAILVVSFFAHWVVNDYYLFYIIGFSSAVMIYGFWLGLLSFLLTVISYSALLYFNMASPQLYLRLLILLMIFAKFFISQYKSEKIEKFLKNVLDIETAKQDFIALASHNLRTPVSAIYGYIDLLLRGDFGQLNNQQTDFIKKIKLNNQELEKTTESLLQISIFEIGREVNLFKQQSQIEMVIQNVIEKFTPAAKQKGLDLIFQKQAGSLPLVNIDVEKITAVLSNLVDNAIKYTERGIVTITAVRSGEFIEVSVRDTGIGIPEDDLTKVFTKFFRSGNVLIYNQTGSGLGLYLGKQIIELHGGKINISSIVNQGTVVRFMLPILKSEVL